MFIEFSGAPGTGKTTLTPIVIQFLREQGLRALTIADAMPLYATRTPWGKIICATIPRPSRKSALWRIYSYSSFLYGLKFAIKHYAFRRYVVKLQRGRPIPRHHQRLIRSYFDSMMADYQFLECHIQPDEILVLDEGFAHRVTHLVSELEQPHPDNIMQYLKLAPKSDLVILVRAPVSTCVQRLCARGLRGRLSGKNQQEVGQFVANAEKAIDISARYLRYMGTEIIEVDNDGNLNACVASLNDRLETLVCTNTHARESALQTA